jgi:hypothetical protein
MSKSRVELHTVILVSDAFVVRTQIQRTAIADSGSLQVLAIDRLDRPEHGDMRDAVQESLHFDPLADGSPNPIPPECRYVWVLTDEAWSGRITLSKAIVNAIDPSAIEQTLALEAEQESGISPFDSRLSFVRLSENDDATTWWVTHVEKSLWDDVESSVALSAGQLAGLTAITLSSDDSLPTADPEREAESVADESFAVSWLSDHLSDRISIPVITKSEHTHIDREPSQGRLIAAALILAICFCVDWYGSARVSQASFALSQLSAEETELLGMLKRAKADAQHVSQAKLTVEARRAADVQRQIRVQASQSQRIAQRQRPIELLDSLAVTANATHWITHIEMTPERFTLHGLAVNSEAVTKLSQAIEAELGHRHWRVEPAQMSSNLENLIEFELVLIPVQSTTQHFVVRWEGGIDVR